MQKRSVLLIQKDKLTASMILLLKHKTSFVYVSSIAFQNMPSSKTEVFFLENIERIGKNKYSDTVLIM